MSESHAGSPRRRYRRLPCAPYKVLLCGLACPQRQATLPSYHQALGLGQPQGHRGSVAAVGGSKAETAQPSKVAGLTCLVELPCEVCTADGGGGVRGQVHVPAAMSSMTDIRSELTRYLCLDRILVMCWG